MRITVEEITGIFPDGYKEVYNLDGSVKKLGLYEEEYFTEKPYRTSVNFREPARRQRVQSLIYDRYVMEGIANSTQSVELLKYGKVTVEDDRGLKVYKAVAIDVQREELMGRWYRIRYEFYDVNPMNYALNKLDVINYLESGYVEQKYGLQQLNTFQVWDIATPGVPFYSIHTALVPQLYTEQPRTNPIESATGEEIHTAVITKQYIEGLFFILDEQMEQVTSLISFAGDRKIRASFRANGKVYNLIETPKWEVTEIGNELWQLKIKYMYNIVKHYEYA